MSGPVAENSERDLNGREVTKLSCRNNQKQIILLMLFGNLVVSGICRGVWGSKSPLNEWTLCTWLCSVTLVDLQGPVEIRLSVDYAYYTVFMCDMKLHDDLGRPHADNLCGIAIACSY